MALGKYIVGALLLTVYLGTWFFSPPHVKINILHKKMTVTSFWDVFEVL